MSDKGNIKDLVFDGKNFNRHSEYGMALLEKSVGKFGMGRSILVDKDNRIIAGNGITETAGNIGIEKVRFIDTDGSEIIAVRRNDISLDSPEGREMALADNATNQANLKWDKEAIAEELGQEIAEGWGIEAGQDIDEAENTETLEINVRFKSEDECRLWFDKFLAQGLDARMI